MPRRAKRPCSKPGCGRLADGRYCDRHPNDDRKQADRRRGSSTKRGYGYRWQKYREQYLKEHPLCVMDCEAEGRVTASTTVDHIIPHKGDQELFWDPDNHHAGCKTCHDRKTATQDGGFGRIKG